MIDPGVANDETLLGLVGKMAAHALDEMVLTIEQVGGDDATTKMSMLSMAMARIVMDCAETDREAALDTLQLLVAWAGPSAPG